MWVFLRLKPVCEILVLHWSWRVLIDLRETRIMAISSKMNNLPFVNLYIIFYWFNKKNNFFKNYVIQILVYINWSLTYLLEETEETKTPLLPIPPSSIFIPSCSQLFSIWICLISPGDGLCSPGKPKQQINIYFWPSFIFVYQKSWKRTFKTGFEYKITFSLFYVKKLVWNVLFKAVWYTNISFQLVYCTSRTKFVQKIVSQGWN